jgi:hypothetical protein
MTALGLFDAPEPIPLPEVKRVSADRRRTIRQAEALTRRTHPLSLALGYHIRLHEDAAPAEPRDAPGRRCGNCWYRETFGYHNRSYPKCLYGAELGHQPPRFSNGAGTDVRGWWPACPDHTYADPAVSADAARWVP